MAACTNNQQLRVHTFHSFDIHFRIVSVLLSFHITFALVAFFSFLATLLALARLFLAFHFPGDGIDFH